jgi:hypothetical protein
MRLLPNVPLLAIALSLCASAPVSGPLHAAPARQPPEGATPDTARLHRALADALGEHFRIEHTELSGGLYEHGGRYWLVHATPRRSGMYELRYRYDYRDLTRPEDPLYTHVEHTSSIRVGERGCWRRRQATDVCLGDTLILPFVVSDTGHTFALTFREPPADGFAGYADRPAAPGTEAVPNPLAAHLGYLGTHQYEMPSRARTGHGRTLTSAEFVAVAPGRFNLSLSSTPSAAGSVPIVIVPRGQPVTVLLTNERITASHATQGFASHWGNQYLTTVLLLQPGDRVDLEYAPAGGTDPLAPLSAALGVADSLAGSSAPVIARFPFRVDPAERFNAFIIDHLPAAPDR